MSSSANSFDTVRGAIQLILILTIVVCVILKNKIAISVSSGLAILIGILDLSKAGEAVRACGEYGSRGAGYFFILIGILGTVASVAWMWVEETGVLKKA